MPPPDPRVTPYRPDLAAAHLRGTVEAPRYAEPEAMEIVADVAPFRDRPDRAATQVTQALHGEAVRVYERAGAWAWAQIVTDDYVGHVELAALGPPGPAKTHKVAAIRSYLFPEPDLKAPPLGLLGLGSPLAVTGEARGFLALAGGGFVWAGHVAPADVFEADPIAVAARFLGTPYLWGGRTSIGLDCSALVQLALAATGVDAPRDSDMQMALGAPAGMAGEGGAGLRRGDLVFWAGHVAFVSGPGLLLHANAHHMAVAEEPLAAALARIGASGLKVLGVRRLLHD